MAAKPRKVWRDAAEKRALQLLAGAPHGCTQKILRAHGFKVGLLSRIVRAGFAVAKPEIVKVGGRTVSVPRLTITALGRQALAGDDGGQPPRQARTGTAASIAPPPERTTNSARHSLGGGTFVSPLRRRQ